MRPPWIGVTSGGDANLIADVLDELTLERGRER